MEIELINADGITLKTKGKYCSEDIDIIPKLQTKAVTTNGSVVADEGYCGLDSVTVAVPATPTQEKTVDLAMASGNQVISPDAGKNLSKVTVTKPSTLVAGNIKTGVSIGGVTGTLEVKKEEEAKTVDLAMASGNQTITPMSGKVLSQVVVKKPATMLPENIKKDVNIGGVTGTLESGGGGELNIHYGNTAPEDTSKLWIKSEKPSNISFPVVWKPEQIVEGITDTGTTLPTAANSMGSAAVGTKIYLFGGSGENGRINTIQVFDTTNNTIQTLSTTLPTAANGIGTAAVGTKIYLFGGYNNNNLNTIQVFDTTNNTIQTLSTTLPTAAYGIGTAAVGTKIYLFGGDADSGQTNAIRVFDTTNNTIQTLSTTLPTAANSMGSAAVGTKIYLFGGSGENGKINTIQVFDTTNNTIQTLSTTLPTAASGIRTVAVGTKIYLFGGYNNNNLNTINQFTVDVPLSSNDIIVTQEYYSRTFKVMKAPTEVEVACKYVYKGDQNLAKFIDAYLYDGANWVNVNTGATVAISRTITPTLTNVTAASGNATTIATGETKVLTYTAASGYTLPDSVTVTGATGVWNKDAGTLTLSNPTGNVTFTIAGVEAAAGYNVTVTAEWFNFDIYDGQSASGTYLGNTNDSGGSITVVCTSGYLFFDTSAPGDITSVTGGVTIIDSITVRVTGDGTVSASYSCIIEGTQITLANGSTKAIEDITYDDELLVWNFYDGKFDKAKPSWIKVEETAPRYNLVKFSNGSEVGFVGPGGDIGYHRVFNKEAKAFTHTGVKDTPNGTTTFAQDGTFPTVVSQEVVEKEVKFYNVITDKHYNIFANGILTSCKLSNKYHIENMRYIGEKLISDEQEKAYFERIESKRK